jgi:pSer/pThr/pTyr-binding forkhead associated (FHA) protein
MAAFLDIVAGPHAGTSVPLADGVTRVGRGVGAHYILEGDNFLSESHFSVDARNDNCVLEDQASLNGTFTNGMRVERSELNDGDWIVAGHSIFGFRAIGEPAWRCVQPGRLPPRPGWQGPHRSPQLSKSQNRAMDILATQPGRLYAVLDAARDARIRSFLQAQGGQSQSLFEGETARTYAHVAPYLVSLTSTACEQLIQISWQLSCGIFIHSAMSSENIKRHLRNFLVAETPDGKRMLFRFYDPRPLRVYLQACNAQELAAFFGNNYSFVMEDKQPGRWMCVERGAGQPKIDYAVLEDEQIT